MENFKEKKTDDILEKLVHINRITKVVKGGRRFGFAALVVVGDQRGKVGFGTGKAKEVPEAIKKATEDAKKNMESVILENLAVKWVIKNASVNEKNYTFDDLVELR